MNSPWEQENNIANYLLLDVRLILFIGNIKLMNIYNQTIQNPIKMKTLILLICATIALGQQPNGPLRLPLFVGRGYDVLLGNPLSSKVDPGFSQGIFALKYTQGKTTEDGKYLVPDEVQSRQVSSCFLSSSTQTYRGSQSYQSELKTKVSVSAGYNGLLIKASFSASRAFQKMEKETVQQNMTYTHAMAECQAYEIAINTFAVPTFQENFIQAVNESYYANNWENFILQFGTHYVYQTIMGGRAIQEIAFQSQSISKLESINIDINIAAKASFAAFYFDSSFDWSKHKEEISYVQKTSKSISQLYIGGEPSRDGDIRVWMEKVKENPMPITYKVTQISNLFNKVKGIKIDVAKAVQQFNVALDKYCKDKDCKAPSPDKPKPLPAYVQVQQTTKFGGTDGKSYQFFLNSTTMSPMKVSVLCGSQIDQLQLLFSDGVRSVYSPKIGGVKGNPKEFIVPEGQYVSQVEFHWSNQINGLVFITNKGTKSQPFGNCGSGNYGLLTFPDGYKILGFFGSAGDKVNSLGFYIGKTIYPVGGGLAYLQTKKINLVSQ